MKKTKLGPGSKAMHLAYLGDAVIGEKVNIGAGTITCNYDGKVKQTTTIEDGAFIGSDTQLIAPITVGKNAYVGTGTTLREDVPPGALAGERRQAAEHRGLGGEEGRGQRERRRREVRAQASARSEHPRSGASWGWGPSERSKHVWNHRLHRSERRRPGPDRRPAQA